MKAPHSTVATEALTALRERRSAKWRMAPGNVLPLTIAEMDFQLCTPVRDALQTVLDASDTGYAFPAPDLGRAFAGFASDRWGWTVDPEQVTAVTDVGVGIVEILRTVIEAGDRVAISPPVYPPFFDWVDEVRAQRVDVPLAVDATGTWSLDLEALERAFATGVKAYILCNPHNPVGVPHSQADLTALVEIAARRGVTIVSDEIHAPLVLGDDAFCSILDVDGGAEVAVSLVSASKAWNLAGLKCAQLVTASPRMAALVDRLPADTKWRAGHWGVVASIAAYDHGRSWLDALLVELTDRRDHLDRAIHGTLPGVTWQPSRATFLAWLDCSALDLGNRPSDEFLERGRVAVSPGTDFGTVGEGFVRLNYATSAEILDEGIARMATVIAGTR